MTRKPSKTRELRAWLRGIGATHVVVEGHTERRRTVTVTTACTLARACQPTRITVADGEAVIWKGQQPHERIHLIIHTPTTRQQDGTDHDGRPYWTHTPTTKDPA